VREDGAMKKLLGVAGALALVGLVAWAISVSGRTDPAITAPADQSGDPVVSLAEGLEVPWDLSFLP